jgi:phosphate starvation-inducible PhoH-like protein
MTETTWQDMRDKDVLRRLAAGRKRVEAKTPRHADYLRAIDEAKAVVCVGPAGTGKTFMACGKAVELLRAGKVSRLVITRPLQECGEEIGILPGDLWEKIVDMMAPLLDALDEFLGPGELEGCGRPGSCKSSRSPRCGGGPSRTRSSSSTRPRTPPSPSSRCS